MKKISKKNVQPSNALKELIESMQKEERKMQERELMCKNLVLGVTPNTKQNKE